MTSRPFSGPFDNQHSEIQRLSAILGFIFVQYHKKINVMHLLKKVQPSQQHGYLKIAEPFCREFTDIYIRILVPFLSVWSKSDKVTVQRYSHEDLIYQMR